MAAWIEQLSADLFWDVDQSAVDPEKHAEWLISRTVQRGRWQDWIAIRDYYGRDRLALALPNLKLDPKSANFLRIYCEQ